MLKLISSWKPHHFIVRKISILMELGKFKIIRFVLNETKRKLKRRYSFEFISNKRQKMHHLPFAIDLHIFVTENVLSL